MKPDRFALGDGFAYRERESDHRVPWIDQPIRSCAGLVGNFQALLLR
jgi:hypothetical protein